MGLFDKIGDAWASGDRDGESVQQLLGLVTGGQGTGGLAALVDQFKQKGLGGLMNSWIGTGANEPIQPAQLEQALGQRKIAEIAEKLGVPEAQVKTKLAELLPKVVDRMTPNGRLEGEARAQPQRDPWNSLEREGENGRQQLFGIIAGGQGGGGGLDSLVDQFKQKGLGGLMNSWIGTGANEPIQPRQLEDVLGQGRIEEIAKRLGVDADEVKTRLSDLLPKWVDEMTPSGRIEQARSAGEYQPRRGAPR